MKFNAATLQSTCSGATMDECNRFMHSFPKDADEKLNEYLEWRKMHDLDDQESMPQNDGVGNEDFPDLTPDERDWQISMRKAIEHTSTLADMDAEQPERPIEKEQQKKKKKISLRPKKRVSTVRTASFHEQSSSELDSTKTYPQLCFTHPKTQAYADAENWMTDSDGNLIIQMLPARIDVNAFSADTYATALALYLEKKIGRHHNTNKKNQGTGSYDFQQCTILLDVRPGHGWMNPPAHHILGFIRHVANFLYNLYPGRLHRLIIFPVPYLAIPVWNIAKAFLDSSVVSRIVLISGSANRNSPVPKEKLQQYMEADYIETFEKTRINAFEEE